jgi:hypothetical protein
MQLQTVAYSDTTVFIMDSTSPRAIKLPVVLPLVAEAAVILIG